MTNTDRNDDIYKVIDEITDHLATLTKEERISWFKRNMYQKLTGLFMRSELSLRKMKNF